MEVPTITMPKAEARKRLTAYRRALRRRADEEYTTAAAGYEALAQGTPLISLDEAIRSGGFEEKGRPRLAVARADRKQVRFDWWAWNTWGRFDCRSRRTSRSANATTLVLDVELGEQSRDYLTGYALIPMVPPEALEEAGIGASALHHHFILWEVEEWADKPLHTEPDRDPLLIEHLAGDLYVVKAAWDLTDLERAVMAGRRDG